MKFEDLKFDRREDRTEITRHTFPNGYGVSVVRGRFSYGGPDGLYELAVLKNNQLCYDTPITSDVEGHLTPEDVTELLAKVEALSPDVEPNADPYAD